MKITDDFISQRYPEFKKFFEDSYVLKTDTNND